jgi:hypothetical protein
MFSDSQLYTSNVSTKPHNIDKLLKNDHLDICVRSSKTDTPMATYMIGTCIIAQIKGGQMNFSLNMIFSCLNMPVSA